jgi:succinate-semialdehyde dehydrogenase/glutarate-semialdehyde dehydrogenase
MSIQTINPATEELLETFEIYSQDQVDQAIDEAHVAFLSWRSTTFEERAKHLFNVAKYLCAHESELARIATLEMGKPIAESESEVKKCAWNCEYFAENAQWFLEDERIVSYATESYVAFRPLGVILAIMPWNFPYWQVFRFAAPALMAGNTIVLKHASNVSRVALEIERIIQEAGLPRGVLRTVLVHGSEATQLVKDDRIAAITLTGSEEAGVSVASASSRALKKHVLELGGSDAFIILEDADLDQAAKAATIARFQNAGQSCIASKRFIVVERVAEEFEHKFVDMASSLRMGNPLDYKTQIGPLARRDLRDTLHEQVQASVNRGARILLGGNLLEGIGNFYAPTIVTGVTLDMPMFREETFGPAAAIIHARDVDHAIELANDSRYGLSCSLWTRDIGKGRELAAQIEAGGCFINGMSISDPRLPFGGIKHSGYGRELAAFGIREFVNIQTVWIGPKVENRVKIVTAE